MKGIIKDGIKIAATIGLLLAGSLSSQAKPAKGNFITVEQPDGSALTLRLIGDERSHLYLTSDHIPLSYTPESGYVYTHIDGEGIMHPTGVMAHNPEMRTVDEQTVVSRCGIDITETLRTHRINRYPKQDAPGQVTSTFPTTGEQKGLVILVEFTDVKFGDKAGTNKGYDKYSSSANAVHEYWTDMLNKKGFDGYGGNGSCRDWFISNSTDRNGNVQFTPTFDLFGPVTLPHNMAYYGANDSYGDDKRAWDIVIDGCKALDNEIDFSQYDRDHDGKVDNVYVFYAGFGEADYGGDDTIWPHSYNLSYVWKDFELDGVTIDHYACSNEIDHTYMRPDGVGTFIHEFSHVMGLPDLYATDYSSSYTPGEFSVLDIGPYNNQGRTPPNYSSYERYALKWLERERFGKTAKFTIENLAESNRAYYVPTDVNREFFFVENRQRTGWDAYIPAQGMLIWHIDYVKNKWTYNQVNNDPSHQYVDLIEANGLQSYRYAGGHSFPGASNITDYTFVSWNGNECNVELHEIAESNGNILVSVIDNYSAVEEIAASESDNLPYYNLQGIPVTNPKSGEILIHAGRVVRY